MHVYTCWFGFWCKVMTSFAFCQTAGMSWPLLDPEWDRDAKRRCTVWVDASHRVNRRERWWTEGREKIDKSVLQVLFSSGVSHASSCTLFCGGLMSFSPPAEPHHALCISAVLSTAPGDRGLKSSRSPTDLSKGKSLYIFRMKHNVLIGRFSFHIWGLASSGLLAALAFLCVNEGCGYSSHTQWDPGNSFHMVTNVYGKNSNQLKSQNPSCCKCSKTS